MAKKNRAFERIIDLAVGDMQAPEFQKYVADYARKVLAEELRARDSQSHTTVVDGVAGASEDSVRYGGIIRYNFGNTAVVVQAALDWLRHEGAKVGTKYANAFFVGVLTTATHKHGDRQITTYHAEGRKIAASAFGAASKGLPADANYIIGNERPENRKIDVQLMGGEDVSFSVDPHIFDRCAFAIAKQYRGFNIDRVYTLTFTDQWRLRFGPRADKPVHSPGLVISRI